MKVKTIYLIAAFLLAAVLLSGCQSPVASGYPSVIARGATVYLADGGFLYAIIADSGKQVWQYPQKRDGKKEFYAAPVLSSEDRIIVPSSGSDHSIYSIDPTHLSSENVPAENWVFAGAKDRWIASPLLLNDSLFAPNGDGTLYVLDLDGKLKWSLKVGGPLWTTPVSDGKLIYLTSLDHFLYAIDPETHSVAWKADLGGTSTGAPALTGEGNILAGSFGSRLLAFSPTGSSLWQQNTVARIWATPIVNGGIVFATDMEGSIYFFDASTGEPRREAIKPGGAIIAAPFVWNDLLVFVTETGSVIALDQDGKIVWQKDSDVKYYSTPAAAGDLLFVPMLENKENKDVLMIAYDRDGKQVWAFKPEK